MYTDPTGKFACLAPTAVRTEAGHRSAKQYIAFCNEQSNRLNTSKATGKLSRIRAIDGLLELFADPELPGGTGTQATQRRQKRLTEAQERLEFILWYTTDGPMVNFNNIDFWTGEGVKRSDEGFALELRDSDIWVASSRQVGHFLTAANMGYSPSFMERSFTACIVGHEKLGDQTGIRHNLFQCLHSSNIDVMLFEAAANADREGNYALRDCFIVTVQGVRSKAGAGKPARAAVRAWVRNDQTLRFC